MLARCEKNHTFMFDTTDLGLVTEEFFIKHYNCPLCIIGEKFDKEILSKGEKSADTKEGTGIKDMLGDDIHGAG